MKYHEALKTWNAHKKTVNPAHGWFVPRKGTPEHTEVLMIQKGTSPDRAVGDKPDLRINVPKEAHADNKHAHKAVAEVKHETKKKLGGVATGEMKLAGAYKPVKGRVATPKDSDSDDDFPLSKLLAERKRMGAIVGAKVREIEGRKK